MRRYEKRTREYDHEIAHTCDLCNADMPDKVFRREECEIRAIEASAYPEGTFGVGLNAEFCLDCFKNRILPALRALGMGDHVKWESIDW